MCITPLAGCDNVGDSGDDKRIDFSPLERDSRLVETVPDPGPPVDLSKRPEYKQIVESFRANAETLLRRDDIGTKLDQIEKIFVATGRYLELVAIYQELVDKLGLQSEAAPRLAWAYVRLGQRNQARQFLDELSEARPDDPAVAFVDGSFWFNKINESGVAAARAVLAWEKVVKLDPNFTGYEGVSAASLRQQIERIEARLPASPEAVLRAAEERGEEGPGVGQQVAVPEQGGEPLEPTDTEMAAADVEEEADAGDASADAGVPSETSDTGVDDTGTDADTGEAVPDTSGPAPAPSEPKATPIPILLTRADLALGQGELDRAESTFQEVLERDSDNLDARIGLLRVEGTRNPNAGELAGTVESLLQNERVTASQAYDLGLFARVKLQDDDLAQNCWAKVRELDPEYADQLGLD